MDALKKKMVEARLAARSAEREFLVARGWQEQGTYDDVTWWYYEGMGSSVEQRVAVRYALREIDKRVFDKRDADG